ncbi:MAG TPA: hypothetical protein VN772_02675 [Solirubrobacteraceae bacterium]|nr:hypothetical protein [Solirubrobacteraceae bacterium]
MPDALRTVATVGSGAEAEMVCDRLLASEEGAFSDEELARLSEQAGGHAREP